MKNLFQEIDFGQVLLTVPHAQTFNLSINTFYFLLFCSLVFKIWTVNNAEKDNIRKNNTSFEIEDLKKANADKQRCGISSKLSYFPCKTSKLTPPNLIKVTISCSEYKNILDLVDQKDASVADVWNKCPHFRWLINAERTFKSVPPSCLFALIRAEFPNMYRFLCHLVYNEEFHIQDMYMLSMTFLGLCCSFFSDNMFTKFESFATRKQTTNSQEDSVFNHFHYRAGLSYDFADCKFWKG